MENLHYDSGYTLRDFLKGIKKEKLYGKFLIAIANAFYRRDTPQYLFYNYLRVFDKNTVEEMVNSIRSWNTVEENDSIII